jgi:AAA15 family ATPase/GTPase
MTTIETVSISNFKAVDSLQIDVGALNIITGGNNAGKTSLLQAIDLAFNPKSVTSYESDVGYLINAHSETASINIEYTETTQTSLSEFMESDTTPTNIHERNLKIIEPDSQEKIQLLIDAALDVAKTGPNADLLVNRFSGESLQLDSEGEDPDELIQNAVSNSIASLPEEQLRSWAEGNSIILEVNGSEYPYVYLGGFYDEFKSIVVEESTNTILNKLGRTEEPLLQGEENELATTIKRSLNDLLVPRFGRGRFKNGEPPSLDGVRFVSKSVKLSKDDVDIDQDNAAVRLSNISDYLQENNLVDEIDTLSLDQIVFKDTDGDKYQIPYNFMGDGFKAMVGLLWELSDKKRRGNVLLLEEAENHMHPEYINQLSHHLTEILERGDIQTFITTHNVDFIRAFLEIPDKDLEKFLIDEFHLLKMDPDLPEEYDYLEAKNHATDLQLDLRG